MTDRESRKITNPIYTHQLPAKGRYSVHWSEEYSDGATIQCIVDDKYNNTTYCGSDRQIFLEFPRGVEPPVELFEDTDRFVQNNLSRYLNILKEMPGVIICTKSEDKYRYQYVEGGPKDERKCIGVSVPGGGTFSHTCDGDRHLCRTYSVPCDDYIVGMHNGIPIFYNGIRNDIVLLGNNNWKNTRGSEATQDGTSYSHTTSVGTTRSIAVSVSSAERPKKPFRHIYRNLPRNES